MSADSQVPHGDIVYATDLLAEHILAWRTHDIPAEVAEVTKRHLLDGIIAIISGATLEPGRLGAEFAAKRQAVGESTIIRTGGTTSAEMAAFANGMAAHADETDDINDPSRIHPGCALVSAALACAEAYALSGEDLLRSLALGYDVGCSMTQVVWAPGDDLRRSLRSPDGVGQLFGSMATAAAGSGLDRVQIHSAISFAAEQAGGLTNFSQDKHHVQKAFMFGAKPAFQGVWAVEMVRSGFTGIADSLDRPKNLIDSMGTGQGDVARLPALLADHHVMNCDIKRWPVGMPIQAAAQALEELMVEDGVVLDDVDHLVCRLPEEKASIVDSTDMPDINLQYILSVQLMDGRIGWDAAHDYERFRSADVQAVMKRVDLVHDVGLNPREGANMTTRRAVVEAHLIDGRVVQRRVDPVRGIRLNRFSWADMEQKAADIIGPMVGEKRLADIILTIKQIESVDSARKLVQLLTPQ